MVYNLDNVINIMISSSSIYSDHVAVYTLRLGGQESWLDVMLKNDSPANGLTTHFVSMHANHCLSGFPLAINRYKEAS